MLFSPLGLEKVIILFVFFCESLSSKLFNRKVNKKTKTKVPKPNKNRSRHPSYHLNSFRQKSEVVKQPLYCKVLLCDHRVRLYVYLWTTHLIIWNLLDKNQRLPSNRFIVRFFYCDHRVILCVLLVACSHLQQCTAAHMRREGCCADNRC